MKTTEPFLVSLKLITIQIFLLWIFFDRKTQYKKFMYQVPAAYLEPSRTSIMEFFTKIVKS